MIYKIQKNNLIKYCRECSCELIIGSNWTKSNQKNYVYICNSCHSNYNKKNCEKDRERVRKRDTVWSEKNRDKRNISNAKYVKSLKGKIAIRKGIAKRRGLGDITLFDNPFPDNIPIVKHHISDGFEFYLPKSLHLNHYTGRNTKKHRTELKPYIEGIYNISYIII